MFGSTPVSCSLALLYQTSIGPLDIGHTGLPGNEVAESLAKAGAAKCLVPWRFYRCAGPFSFAVNRPLIVEWPGAQVWCGIHFWMLQKILSSLFQYKAERLVVGTSTNVRRDSER